MKIQDKATSSSVKDLQKTGQPADADIQSSEAPRRVTAPLLTQIEGHEGNVNNTRESQARELPYPSTSAVLQSIEIHENTLKTEESSTSSSDEETTLPSHNRQYSPNL